MVDKNDIDKKKLKDLEIYVMNVKMKMKVSFKI